MQERSEKRQRQAHTHTQPQTQPRTKQRALSNEEGVRWQGERPWPVKVLTWLLGLEGVSLALTAYLYLRGGESLTEQLVERPFLAMFFPLSVMALIATLGFLQLRPGAWVIAMLVQGLMLLTALASYVGDDPREPILYVMMVYGIVMVVYLNYANVPLVFRMQPGPPLAEEAEREPVP